MTNSMQTEPWVGTAEPAPVVHCNDWPCDDSGLAHMEGADALVGNSDADCCVVSDEPVHCNHFDCETGTVQAIGAGEMCVALISMHD